MESNHLGRDNWFTASLRAVRNYASQLVRAGGFEPPNTWLSTKRIYLFSYTRIGGPSAIRTRTVRVLKPLHLPVVLPGR
jgi:hypothetical protein